MLINKTINHSDLIGAVASGLCVVHCIATPFLFIVHTCQVTGCCTAGPAWWNYLDYFFIAVTFFAVHWSSRNTSKSWIKYGLYSSWLILSLLVINEKMAYVPLSELWKYSVAFILIGLHLYNRKYCNCADNECCAVPAYS